jgi:hypothetical protein
MDSARPPVPCCCAFSAIIRIRVSVRGNHGRGLSITAHPPRRVLPAWIGDLLAGQAGQSPRTSITVCYQRGQRGRRWNKPAFPVTMSPELRIATRLITTVVLPAWTAILICVAGGWWPGRQRRVDGMCYQHGRIQAESVRAAWTVCASIVDGLCQHRGHSPVHVPGTQDGGTRHCSFQ